MYLHSQFRLYVLTLLLLGVASPTLAQKSSQTGKYSDGLVSLEGSEAVLNNGEPSLRVAGVYGTNTVVKFEKKVDGEVFIFDVYKISYKLPTGKLIVSRSEVIFAPDEKESAAFRFNKEQLLEVKVNKRGFLVLKTDKTTVDVLPKFGPVEGQQIFAASKPIYSFIISTIQDFDGASNVFNRLTQPLVEAIEKQKKANMLAQLAAAEKLEEQKEARRLAQLVAEEKAKMMRLAQEKSVQEHLEWAKEEQARIREYEARLAIALTKNEKNNLSPTTKAKVEFALKALRRMKAATDVGVTLSEYSSRLIDAKVEVDEAITVLSNGFLKEELKLALESFIDVSKAWNEMGKNDFLMSQTDTGWRLLGSYGLQIDNSTGSPRFSKSYVLSAIWTIAANHIENATKLTSTK